MDKINTNRRLFPVALFFAFFSLPLAIIPAAVNGGIIFSDLDLSADNQLLFRAGAGNGDRAVQDALFVTRLPASVPDQNSAALPVQQLSAFPEKMELLGNGQILQIRNAFGAMRVSPSGGLPMPIPGLHSFAGDGYAVSGRAEEMASSADGRWLLYLEPVSPAYGDLYMLDALSGTKILVASRLERPEKLFPASWSPDSRFFVYERGSRLYYYMAGSQATPVNEQNRFIGEGTINSVFWGRGGDFFYLSGSTLYQVRGAELVTRALYSDFLAIGTVAGMIPFEFDPAFDRFWVAPGGRSVLVSKGHRSLFYYPLDTDDASDAVLPYLLLPRSCSEINVLWSNGGIVTVLVSIPDCAGTEVRAWRLDLSGGAGAAFYSLPPPGKEASFPSGALSPDGSLALLWGDGGVLLYDYAGWKPLEVLGSRPGTACLWAADDMIISGDNEKIERISLKLSRGTAGPLGAVPSGTAAGAGGQANAPLAVLAQRDLVCLSSASGAGFEDGSSRILAKGGDAWFVTDGRNPWTPINDPRTRSASQVSAQYRVYIAKQGSGSYVNLPMIRNTASVGTFPLFSLPQIPAASNAVPESDPPFAPDVVFSRGLRNGAKEAALCFDLYDDDQGLPETLAALNRYGIKATFFFNGEFIRRHPLAVQDISAAGHDAASMFFAPMDFSDTRYRGGSDFISRGLARNEDEFYRVTGKELSLLWHPPWYMVSRDIVNAAAGAGYITSGRDVDPMDWVSRDDEKTLGFPQRTPSEMVDNVMQAVKPGSIIPVRLGLLPGGRNDYLFNRINVLIDALIREGYTLTTVSTLIDHAK